MKKSIAKTVAASAVLVVATLTGQAKAGFTEGSFEAGGWDITYPAETSLSVVPGGPTSTLELTSSMTFSLDKSALITFVQVDPNAASTIILLSDDVVNQTGASWTGFNFLTESPIAKAGGQFTSSGDVFTTISPFTAVSFDPQIVQFSGGVVPNNGGVNFSNGGTGSGLVITATPTLSGTPAEFVLKEIPVGDGPDPAIPSSVPLPAAFWSSLSVLLGLALIPMLRRVRSMLL